MEGRRAGERKDKIKRGERKKKTEKRGLEGKVQRMERGEKEKWKK